MGVFVMKDIKIVQFGEGNFLRGFVDEMIDRANEAGVMDAGVAIVKPREHGDFDVLKSQKLQYHTVLRGKQDGSIVEQKRLINCVAAAVHCYAEYSEYAALARLPSLRIIISNTTEAGIVYDESDRFELNPPNSFPGKLTKFLYDRFTYFGDASEKGLIILPVELIENNGDSLRDCVFRLAKLWNLPLEFAAWVRDDNIFCNTLVDRIITGFPHEEAAQLCAEFGFDDHLIVAGEPFGLWVIESDRLESVKAALPLDKAGLPVIFTDNQRPYRERKVRILNGAHTGTVLAAYLAGLDTVGQCMENAVTRAFMERLVYTEIAQTVPLPPDEVAAFSDSVMERFENPFIRHELRSIALNSVSKWKSRILPSLRDSYRATGKLPPCLTFSFAALLAYYTAQQLTDAGLVCANLGRNYTVSDDASAMSFFAQTSTLPTGEYVRLAAENESLWGEDLTKLPGFSAAVSAYLHDIREAGASAALEKLLRC